MKNKDKLKKILLASAVFLFFITALALGVAFANWSDNHKDGISPHTKIGIIDLSGLKIDLAQKKVSNRITELENKGLLLNHNGKQITLPAVVASTPDLSTNLFSFNHEDIANNISQADQDSSFFVYLYNKFRNLINDNNVAVVYALEEDRIKSYVAEAFTGLEIEPLNASFVIESGSTGDIKFEVTPERLGKKIDYSLLISDLRTNLSTLSDQEIIIKTISARPTVYQDDLKNLALQAKELIKNGDIVLINPLASSSTLTIKKEVIATWIEPNNQESGYNLGLNQEKINTYLKDNLSPKIDKAPEKSKYDFKDGKVTSWQTGKSGLELDTTETATRIKNAYLSGIVKTDLVIKEITEEENLEDKIKIEEIIGTGHSNFKGSPVNRVHNIEVGAKAVNGTLIAPGEEFSLVKTLGDIDASTGYLPELVIKNNKTIPEYGGGLCQVGTTIFRSAVGSGLPITARQNHSYRVSYYEPAGTDAAIYDPWPDMRFLNDTNNYILIQSRIEKTDIYFDFWGKKDGRIASSSEPVIYNITKPEPTKLVESDDLKPGEKKCTERAHNGADAYFDYQVTYPDGQEKNTRFKSHYVPWQEVCLVGKAATSTQVIATTTPEKTN